MKLLTEWLQGLDDVITGINLIPYEKGEMSNARWYDLSGREVMSGKFTQGIYITNNKKKVVW